MNPLIIKMMRRRTDGLEQFPAVACMTNSEWEFSSKPDLILELQLQHCKLYA